MGSSVGAREAYSATVKKWEQWGNGLALDEIGRKEIREFLDWVHDRAVAQGGSNPGRTANKAREHLRAVMAGACEQGGDRNAHYGRATICFRRLANFTKHGKGHVPTLGSIRNAL